MANPAGVATAPPPPSPAPPDHNSAKPPANDGALTADDRASLLLHHLKTARTDNAALEKAMEVVRGVRKQRNRARNLAKTDGFSLKHLDEILADETKSTTDLVQDAELRTFMRHTAAMPVTGADQLELFQAVTTKGDKSLEPDDAGWAGQGYAAGLRGAEGVPPQGVPPERIQAWTGGWGEGQAKLAQGLKRAGVIEKRRQEATA